MANLADLNNVQGDILISLPKFHESFLFFEINGDQVQKFKQQLGNLIPLITTAAEGQVNLQKVMDHKKVHQRSGVQKPMGLDRLTITGINIAFSQKGLIKLGITDDLDDQPFKEGMLTGAPNLGDNVARDWLPGFKNREVDGVVLVTGDCAATVNTSLAFVRKIFTIDTLEEIMTITGNVRPGAEKGHEHFGFLDGVSQPAIEGIDTNPNPGQETIPQGIVLALRDGDNGVVKIPNPNGEGVDRPIWARDGSFLCFRKLQQKVPEFNTFMQHNALPVSAGPGNPTGADFLAARLVGRWPSGAPLDITPLKDDSTLGGDPLQNDDFSFTTLNPDDQVSQDRCPFAAHIRKSNPRGDLSKFGGATVRRIVRRGIQYGPELTDQEKAENRTIEDRGLLFACYQSNIANGFQFIQQSWVNTPSFPPKGTPPGSFISGLDALIGQPSPLNDQAVRQLSGTDPQDPSTELPFFQWVFPQGGEYFFSPSISALREKFAA